MGCRTVLLRTSFDRELYHEFSRSSSWKCVDEDNEMIKTRKSSICPMLVQRVLQLWWLLQNWSTNRNTIAVLRSGTVMAMK